MTRPRHAKITVIRKIPTRDAVQARLQGERIPGYLIGDMAMEIARKILEEEAYRLETNYDVYSGQYEVAMTVILGEEVVRTVIPAPSTITRVPETE